MPNLAPTLHNLQGLQPQPLASYLSALGVLRLVHRVDENASAAWLNGCFTLETSLDREELLKYFLEDYCPTPITSPWNGGSGYYPIDKSSKVNIENILASDNPRFSAYQNTINVIQAYIQKHNIEEKPEGDDKSKMLKDLRSLLDDDSLLWLDATSVQEEDSTGKTKVRFAPVLGTGGNDGRFEFSSNFMERLGELFISLEGKPEENRELLKAALYDSLSSSLKRSPIGQFDPGSAGGINLSVGFSGEALLNPWYYILMLEGSLVLTAAAVSRFKDASRIGGSFPFTVSHLGAGSGKLGASEGNRNEIWLPLWSKLTSYPEVKLLFSEGRAQIGKQQARNPIEFSLALASHGTSRGLDGFSRYGFLQRNGKSFFATSLGYYPVEEREGASLIRQVEPWFNSNRSGLKDSAAGARAVRRYENAVLEYLSTNRTSALTTALERIGEIHQYLCHTPKLWEASDAKVRPLPTLDNSWASLANDNSAEFGLALSLASLYNPDSWADSLRSQISPYNPEKGDWNKLSWIPRWVGKDVPDRMLGLLRYRLLSKHNHSPIRGTFFAQLADIESFIEESLDDKKLERLLYALCLIKKIKQKVPHETKVSFLPLAYLLNRLALHQGKVLNISEEGRAEIGLGERDLRLPPSAVANMLASGNVSGSLRASRRFLFGRSMALPISLVQKQNLSLQASHRIGAALLFPISDLTYLNIYKQLVQTKP